MGFGISCKYETSITSIERRYLEVSQPGLGSASEWKISTASGRRLLNSWNQSLTMFASGADRAVDFLTSHIKAPRPEALPYANQFAVLSVISRRINSPTSSQFAAIERWFWRTTLSGYFSGWNTGQMARDYAAIAAFVASNPDDIEVQAALPREEIWSLTQFRSNSAVSKMLALMMSYQDPVDILTGQRIDARRSLAWNNDKEYHHFFPKDYLKDKVPPGRANAVANIVLLTSGKQHSHLQQGTFKLFGCCYCRDR